MHFSGTTVLAVFLLTIQVPTLTLCSCLRVRGEQEGLQAAKATPFVRRNLCKWWEKMKAHNDKGDQKDDPDQSYYKIHDQEEDPASDKSASSDKYGRGDDPSHGEDEHKDDPKEWNDKEESDHWDDKGDSKDWDHKENSSDPSDKASYKNSGGKADSEKWGEKDVSKSSGSGSGSGSSYGNGNHKADPKADSPSHVDDPKSCKDNHAGEAGKKASGAGSYGYHQ